MPFTLIKGKFFAVGYSPDGDSVKFAADNIKNWDKIKGKPKLSEKKHHVQLRFEGIDALETHFRPSVKGGTLQHQPLEWAQTARDFLLSSLGIKNVVWGPTATEVVQGDDGTKGYILTRAIDNYRYGRPVSYVFAGAPPKSMKDGQEVILTPAWLKDCVNYRLINAGYAYPTYYQTLFYDLRDEFTKSVKQARTAKRGLWKDDKTGGFEYTNETAITQKYPILPKLFRRLVEHFQKGGDISNFQDFLKKKKDGVLILPQGHHTDALDYVVDVKNKHVGMNVLPENLVFDPEG